MLANIKGLVDRLELGRRCGRNLAQRGAPTRLGGGERLD